MCRFVSLSADGCFAAAMHCGIGAKSMCMGIRGLFFFMGQCSLDGVFGG